MKYVCPDCGKPYTPTSRPAFPRHGRRWVVGKRGEPSGWQWCPGFGKPITEFTEKFEPKERGRAI